MYKKWNPGRGRVVKKWVDVERVERRDRFVVVGIVFMVLFAIFVSMILGVMRGRMGRDCDFIAQSEEWRAVPDYCKVHKLDVA